MKKPKAQNTQWCRESDSCAACNPVQRFECKEYVESLMKGGKMQKQEALRRISAEHNRAIELYPPFHSEHEGLAIILEEFLELQTEIFLKPEIRNNERLEREVVQLAAMALRFLIDLY